MNESITHTSDNGQPAQRSLLGVKSVYFIGIGGIGMSALARYFKAKGISVCGYDRTQTALTRELEAEGVKVHYEEDLNVIPKDTDLVVYTPAVPQDHKELAYYRENGYNVVKRSDVLQSLSSDTFNVCVAGTHGKTTVSTMIAHILRHSGYGCHAFLGGISVNYGSNFWSSENDVSVIEADEYDRSFLKLSPDIAVITSMDADHLDIYGDEKSMQDAYVQFGNAVKPNGLLITKFGLKRGEEMRADKKLTYSLSNDAADAFAPDVQIEEGGYRFSVRLPGALLSGLELKIGGMHNVENCVAAVTVAHALEIEGEKIRAAVAAFKGVRRRFEYVIPPKQQREGGYVYPVFVDDYAHHPEELRALLKSVRSLFPQRKLTVVFQPHLFSRTRDFAAGFGNSLSIANTVILLPIYPAREKPIEGVSSEMILKEIEKDDKLLLDKNELLEWMQKKNWDKEFGEVIVTAGAGDIDAMVQPLKQVIDRV